MNSQNNGDLKTRYLWMDILNIVATMGVILLHCSNGPVHEWDGVFDVAYVWGVFTHTVALWPVCIFLMLSGCNLISYRGGWKKFYLRRFQRIGIPFIAWSIFYAAIFVVARLDELTSTRWQEYITMFINGKYNGNMWFFVPLFALYLTIPFLSVFFKNASKGVVRWMVYFAFIFTSLLPFLFSLFEIDYFTGVIFPLGTSLLIYGCLGYILVKTDVFTDYRNINRLAILSVFIHFVGMIVVMNVFNGSEKTFTTYSSPTCLFIAIAVFLWFKKQDWQKFINILHLSPQTIQSISSCSFGIYLLHGFILSLTRHLHLGIDNRYFGFIIIYAISFVCIWVMKKIPVLRRIVP